MCLWLSVRCRHSLHSLSSISVSIMGEASPVRVLANDIRIISDEHNFTLSFRTMTPLKGYQTVSYICV